MKKNLVLFIIGFVLFGSCSAQNVNVQSKNDVQRIIGTWSNTGTGNDFIFTYTYIFNLDGTYEHSYDCGESALQNNSKESGNYFVNGSKLITTENFYSAILQDFYISSNGKILFIGGFNGQFGIWYEKQE